MPRPRPLTPAREASGPGFFDRLGNQRVVVAVAGLVVLAAIGILGYALYQDRIAPRRELAIKVGERSYPMEYFARRYRMDLTGVNLNTASAEERVFTEVPRTTQNKIETMAIVLQRAGPGLGIVVTDKEIDQALVKDAGFPVVVENADDFEYSPAMDSTIRRALQRDGLTLAQMRAIAQSNLLLTRIQTYFDQQTPERAEQARVRVIQVPSESDARIAIDKIKAGEKFEDLANTVSIDSAGKGQGGERDWLPRGIFPKNVDDIAFSLPLNTVSEPIKLGSADSGNGGENWLVMEVLARESDRALTEQARSALGQANALRWFEAEREQLTITNKVTPEKIRWAYAWTLSSAPTESNPLAPGGITIPGSGGSGLPAGQPGQP